MSSCRSHSRTCWFAVLTSVLAAATEPWLSSSMPVPPGESASPRWQWEPYSATGCSWEPSLSLLPMIATDVETLGVPRAAW